ncbi:PEP-CTERM sorting domain-containing protein [Fischerella sp. JS2]|uniref:PEP-CTERM sorting domain-containing protein n=1 Tax=Fischerella sp. JS2 TaxID=2597771 RepID=UPI0028E4F6BC|nr:PEP-CTERM sorting domain-containing protein [Fischerella sp. JS2]
MSKFIKSFLAGTLLTVGLAIADAVQASAAVVQSSATTMSATLTADNHYGLFTGNGDGSVLNFVGRNEKGPGGSPGTYNWSQAETWTFDINPGEYIYTVIWDDAAVAESWIGEFTLPDGTKLLSDPSSWEYIVAHGSNPGDWGDVPSNSELNTEIANAQWIGAQAVGLNGSGPWGTIAGISSNASFLNVSNPGSQHYTIFRTKYAPIAAAAVPESGSTLGLVAVGAVSVGSLVRRKSKIA